MKIGKVLLFVLASACMASGLGISAGAQVSVTGLKIGGHVGDRIDTCIEERVKKENVDTLVDVFRYKEETMVWQTEFFGKWFQGAVALYQYSRDPELLELITSSAEDFMTTQDSDGYFGNYAPSAQLTRWDIWGRKYSALALIAYYRLTGDERALEACGRSIDHLIEQLHDNGVNIAKTGNFRGAASCSILEPVVYMYELTGEGRYLDFAKEIVSSLEEPGCAQLISKALADVPVSQRAPYPASWWSYDNGYKAYEMMSCYVGMIELGKVTGDPLYREAAERAAESIRRDEINVAGSGTTFECWYGGKARQTQPAFHQMETCVSFTYMQFCSRLFAATGNPVYVGEFERTMYNAMMASLKDDGSMMTKYSPLEGRRVQGEEQCGLKINCCNANGPRGFGLIPQMAVTTKDDAVYVNLYLSMDAEVAVGQSGSASLKVTADWPVSGDVTVDVDCGEPQNFTLALRIPDYVDGASASVNGESVTVDHIGGYLYIDREWKAGDRVELSMGLSTKVQTLNNAQAVVRGPVVFARDSRFGGGDVDECIVILRGGDGVVDAKISEGEGFAWLTLEVPAVLGTDLENPENSEVKSVRFCDFASAGNDWSPTGRYRVWIPQTVDIMGRIDVNN